MTSDPLPDWASEWLPGNCGCGSRLALAACMQNDRHVVCADTGHDIEHCPKSQTREMSPAQVCHPDADTTLDAGIGPTRTEGNN